MAFVIRQLNEGTSLGEKLHSMRKAANLTLSEIAEQTKIRKSYLHAFEVGDYGELPEPLYAKKFLQKYVCALGGDVSYFLQCFDAEYAADADQREQPTMEIAKQPRFSISLNRIFKVGSLVVLSLAIVGYLGWQISGLVAPPDVAIHHPADGTVTQNAAFEIEGETQQDVRVTINGEPVLLSENGTFEKEVALQRGLNIVTIRAAKRYSRETVIERRIILDQKTLGSATFPTDTP